jgi:hypothetical protein
MGLSCPLERQITGGADMRTSQLRFALGVLAAALAFASPAAAEMVTYTATLDGKSEVPPNDSKGTGAVEAKYDTATMKLTWTVTYSGLTGPASAAHFHGPAKAGANAGPIITLATPVTSPATGDATLTKEQAEQLASGMWYLNVHTATHAPGEIRGQLMKK